MAFNGCSTRMIVNTQTDPRAHNKPVQSTSQRIILLSVLAYEAAGALFGGSLLVVAPDGSLMSMPVSMMRGVFSNFLVPGLILLGLGVLNTLAFIAVLRRLKNHWLLAGLALGGLAIWFLVEIAILHALHWLHAMWGLPVIIGAIAAFPLIPRQYCAHYP